MFCNRRRETMKKYFSLQANINIKEPTNIKSTNDKMSLFISKVMLDNKYLQELHCQHGFKHYSFSTPYAKDRQVLYGDYNYEIRSFNKDIIGNFLIALAGYQDDWVKVNDLVVKDYTFNNRITSIQTITPAVATINPCVLKSYNIKSQYKNTYWTNKMPVEILKQAIVRNLQKKYNSLTHRNIVLDCSIIKNVEILNSVPLQYNHKNATLLGNRMKITFNQGKQSQIAARMAVVEGILEKNAILGLGFVKPTYEEVLL